MVDKEIDRIYTDLGYDKGLRLYFAKFKEDKYDRNVHYAGYRDFKEFLNTKVIVSLNDYLGSDIKSINLDRRGVITCIDSNNTKFEFNTFDELLHKYEIN